MTATAVLAAVACYCVMLFGNLSHSLLWNDEAETAMYAERILEFGFPKVHDGRNRVYELDLPLSVGVKEPYDAYIGSPWVQYYFAAPGAWWASAAPNWYARTWRFRLPFAIAGTAGLALLLCAVLTAVERERAGWIATTFWLMAAVSISLLLHLREARHYPLTVLLAGAAILAYVRRHVVGACGWRWWFGVFVPLALLVNLFYVPYFALIAAFSVDQTLRLATRGVRSSQVRREFLSGMSPVAASLLVAAPVFCFFETFSIAPLLSSTLGTEPYGILEHSRVIGGFLLEREFLAPALLAKVAALVLTRAMARQLQTENLLRQATEISNLLWIILVVYIAVVVRLPFSYERYLVLLSPLLIVALLLDSSTCWTSLGAARAPISANASRIGLTAMLLVGMTWNAPVRVADVERRLYEVTHRYEGPLDTLVAALSALHPRPRDLVIATNYEAPSLMYYLGSRVTVGYSTGAELQSDLSIDPDVIVPRGLDFNDAALRQLYGRGRYDEVVFDIARLPCNNVPQLTSSRMTPMTHQFRTRLAGDRNEPLKIYVNQKRRPGGAERLRGRGNASP